MLAFLAAAAIAVPAAEQFAIFKAAGFSRDGGVWKSRNCAAMQSGSYTPGTIDNYRDLNGDRRPEAVVSETSATCYGMAEMHF